jgi:hypothetical protein
MYDTEGITGAVVHATIRLDRTDITRPRDELERALIADAGFKDFDPDHVAVEFIEGRVA